MSRSVLRALIGFLVAPGLPALVLYLINLIVVSHHEALLLAAVLATLAYLSALIVGMPLHFLLQRKGINSLMAYLILGALIGLTCYLLFFGIEALLSLKTYPKHALLLLANSGKSGAMAIAYSSVASLIFWFIAIRKAGN